MIRSRQFEELPIPQHREDAVAQGIADTWDQRAKHYVQLANEIPETGYRFQDADRRQAEIQRRGLPRWLRGHQIPRPQKPPPNPDEARRLRQQRRKEKKARRQQS